jgi:hypothetical protein
MKPRPLNLTWYHEEKAGLLPPTCRQVVRRGVVPRREGNVAGRLHAVTSLRERVWDYAAPQAINSDFTKHHREWIHA